MPRAGLEPATTSLTVNLNDIEDFILFAQAKLNLTKLTAKQYSRRVKAFLKGRGFVTDREIQILVNRIGLDRIVGILCLLTGIIILIESIFKNNNHFHLFIVLFFPSLLYLVYRRKLLKEENFYFISSNNKLFLIGGIVFFFSLTSLIWISYHNGYYTCKFFDTSKKLYRGW